MPQLKFSPSAELHARIQALATARHWSLSQTVGELCEVGLGCLAGSSGSDGNGNHWVNCTMTSTREVSPRLKEMARKAVEEDEAGLTEEWPSRPAAVVAEDVEKPIECREPRDYWKGLQ